ncbi:unnamed protein product [Sphagnum troendelagicum]|uniref:AP2/ERF domain-containing protein n=1 Tax=Sphagnum troendelagicum TaxID=128251 RepID=A0ABP0UKA8_9BRYO
MPDRKHVCPSFPCLYCHGDRGEQLLFPKETSTTAVPLSSPSQCCSHSSKDQRGSCSDTTSFHIGESSTSSKCEGFSHRSKEGRWVAEIRPSRPEWGNLKIALGSYKTRKGAAMAYDVGIFYTGKPVRFNLCSPVDFVEPFPKDRLSFENSQHVLDIARFVRHQAYAYVAKYEKAEIPPSEGLLLHPPENGHQMVPIQGIDSMESKLSVEVNNEELQENHKRIITSTFPSSTGWEKSEMNVAISSSQDLWLKRFSDSLPDPALDHLDFPQLQE